MSINKERLLLLANELDLDADDAGGLKFDLGIWVRPDDVRGNYLDFTPQRNCGTVGCAVGLACVIPEFQKMGLTLSMYDNGSLQPSFESNVGPRAVENFFNITYHEFLWLFSEGSYHWENRVGAQGERAVASRIREFVEDRHARNTHSWREPFEDWSGYDA